MAGLARAVLADPSWARLRTGWRPGPEVAADVGLMLFDDSDEAAAAYTRLEGDVVSQHDPYECAPVVVRAIAAALVEDSVEPRNVGMVLDQLWRVLNGISDQSEIDLGCVDLRERCHAEAQRAYWALARLAESPVPSTRREGVEGVEALDEILADQLAAGLAAGLVERRVSIAREQARAQQQEAHDAWLLRTRPEGPTT